LKGFLAEEQKACPWLIPPDMALFPDPFGFKPLRFFINKEP